MRMARRRHADRPRVTMTNLLWFLILIGVLIFAHESGHFLFAKLFRVKVLTFSLGFGGAIRLGRFRLAFTRGETEYRISWFPIGGFVRMLGEDPTQEVDPAERKRSFSHQAAWKRALIIFGGPMFSLLLAPPIYFAYHLTLSRAAAPVVGLVIDGSPAAQAGIQPGDAVLRVGDTPTRTFEEVEDAINDSEGRPVELEIERGGEKRALRLAAQPAIDETGLELLGRQWDLGIRHERRGTILGLVSPDSPAARAGVKGWDELAAVNGVPVLDFEEARFELEKAKDSPLRLSLRRRVEIPCGAVTLNATAVVDVDLQPLPADQAPLGAFRTAHAYFGFEPIDLFVREVIPGYPAEQNGVVAGDRILSANGEILTSIEQFRNVLARHPRDSIRIQVRHQGEVREFSFVPAIIEDKDELRQTQRIRGLGFKPDANRVSGLTIPRPDRLAYAGRMAFVEFGRTVRMNVMGFVRIFQGRVAASEAVGGPIMIFHVAGKVAEKGLGAFLAMMAFMSILLGLLNLLPVPLLDGGHLAFILIEVLRRRPLSLQARLIASYVGLALLAALMIFAFGNDLRRYWSDFFG